MNEMPSKEKDKWLKCPTMKRFNSWKVQWRERLMIEMPKEDNNKLLKYPIKVKKYKWNTQWRQIWECSLPITVEHNNTTNELDYHLFHLFLRCTVPLPSGPLPSDNCTSKSGYIGTVSTDMYKNV